MNILECQQLSLVKNKQTILSNISFAIQSGDRISVMGPSGSGKSSLFRLLNLLMSPTQGNILYKDKNLQDYVPNQLRRKIAYVLQKPYLFGTTVEENLLYPYQIMGKVPDMAEINTYLNQVQLPKNILKKKNTALSGGEQQRIALIRSLLMKPDILLLDEVTAALDENNTLLLEKLILHEQNLQNITLLCITHHPAQAKRLSQKILHLGEGRIDFYGTTLDFFNKKGDSHE
jgi:putative ABC transport system ATP-binding protein